MSCRGWCSRLVEGTAAQRCCFGGRGGRRRAPGNTPRGRRLPRRGLRRGFGCLAELLMLGDEGAARGPPEVFQASLVGTTDPRGRAVARPKLGMARAAQGSAMPRPEAVELLQVGAVPRPRRRGPEADGPKPEGVLGVCRSSGDDADRAEANLDWRHPVWVLLEGVLRMGRFGDAEGTGDGSEGGEDAEGA